MQLILHLMLLIYIYANSVYNVNICQGESVNTENGTPLGTLVAAPSC